MGESRDRYWFYKLCRKRAFALILFFFILTSGSYILLTSDAMGTGRLEKISGVSGILDTTFSYSAAEAAEYFNSLGEEGREYLLRGIIPLDMLFLLSYTTFLVTLIILAVLIRRPEGVYPERIRYLFAVPIAAGAADLLENLSQAVIIAEYPDYPGELLALLPVLTPAKFILAAAAVFLLFVEISLAGLRTQD